MGRFHWRICWWLMWGCTIRYIKIYQYIEQYTEREREIQLLLFIYIIYIYTHRERERLMYVSIHSFLLGWNSHHPTGFGHPTRFIYPMGPRFERVLSCMSSVPLSPLSLLLYMIVMITILWKILGTVLYIAASSSINIRKIPPLLSAPDVPPMAWMLLYPCYHWIAAN